MTQSKYGRFGDSDEIYSSSKNKQEEEKKSKKSKKGKKSKKDKKNNNDDIKFDVILEHFEKKKKEKK